MSIEISDIPLKLSIAAEIGLLERKDNAIREEKVDCYSGSGKKYTLTRKEKVIGFSFDPNKCSLYGFNSRELERMYSELSPNLKAHLMMVADVHFSDRIHMKKNGIYFEKSN